MDPVPPDSLQLYYTLCLISPLRQEPLNWQILSWSSAPSSPGGERSSSGSVWPTPAEWKQPLTGDNGRYRPPVSNPPVPCCGSGRTWTLFGWVSAGFRAPAPARCPTTRPGTGPRQTPVPLPPPSCHQTPGEDQGRQRPPAAERG